MNGAGVERRSGRDKAAHSTLLPPGTLAGGVLTTVFSGQVASGVVGRGNCRETDKLNKTYDSCIALYNYNLSD